MKKSLKRGKSSDKLKRRPGNKETKKYFLIVVEGEETEYNYFCALKRDLRLSTVELEVVSTSGGDPLVLIDKAHKLFEKNKKENKKEGKPKYDAIFCVFDEDNKSTKYKEACSSANKSNFQAITSIPCFEFWFLLHFCYTNKPFQDCKQLIKQLEKQLQQAGIIKAQQSYGKSNPNLYQILKPKLQNAIDNAEKLEKHQEKDNLNPSTKVHILVKELQNQK